MSGSAPLDKRRATMGVEPDREARWRQCSPSLL